MTKFLNKCHDVNIFIEWDKRHTEKAGSTLEEIYNLLVDCGFRETEDYGNDKLFYKN
jgi:hypothetical protein